MVDETKLPKDIDLITYGFPCQDISIAGKQLGLFNDDGTQTRSGLFFDALRIIEAAKPKIAIAENVKNLTGKKFKDQFEIVLTSLEQTGYNNYWKVLNAKDFGIPQNRERVFIVSIRKDLDNGTFRFPDPFPLTLRLKDMLDCEVDEKYYINNTQIEKIKIKNPDALIYDKSMIGFENNAREYNDVMPTITSREWKEPRLVNETSQYNEVENLKLIQVAQIYPNSGNPQAGRIYDADGLSPSLDTCSGGNRMPKVIDTCVETGGAEING
jgi:DNA (cytosine-5)-methyltransferase 1